MRTLAVEFAAHRFVADDPTHLLARLWPEIVVAGVAWMGDLGRVDAAQSDVRIGVGQDDGVAVDDPHGAWVGLRAASQHQRARQSP